METAGMKKARAIVAAALCAGLLGGCTGTGGGMGDYGTKQTAGTVLGGVAGGVIGSRFGGGTGKLVAVGVGTLLGAAVGNSIGQSLDRADAAHAQRAESAAYTAPIGQAIRWNNPQSGNWGTHTAVRDGYSPGGEYCREFQSTISVDGRVERGAGTACRQTDGSWRIVG